MVKKHKNKFLVAAVMNKDVFSPGLPNEANEPKQRQLTLNISKDRPHVLDIMTFLITKLDS